MSHHVCKLEYMSNLYRITSYSLKLLMHEVEYGRIGLPDIQRPFVWGTVKVRNLLDSMYRGYPVGTLLFWDTGADPSLRQIDSSSGSVAKLAIVDGQQRLTSLYAVLKGKPVITKRFKKEHIRIAFNPVQERFEVSNAAIRKDPGFIPDISTIWDSHRQTVRDFFNRLEASGSEDLTREMKDLYEDRIDRVRDLRGFLFHTVEINEYVEADEVADIFVRTNSQGVTLNQANFILTLMSVYWDKGRRQLEEFCRMAKEPDRRRPSPKNPFIDPSPDQMLRVSVGLAFRRGRLSSVYNILRGKDLDTADVSAERRVEQFDVLKGAQDEVVDLVNWHSFLKCLNLAGFRSRRMVTSDTTLLYTYILWLIGHRDTDLDPVSLQDIIARWFFMAHTTSRYSSSPETSLEADLARISRAGSDGRSFKDELDRMINVEFTADYWEITLPNLLDTSAAKSPVLSAYWAALVLLDAETLLGRQRIRDLIDDNATSSKSLPRHHLFPKAYLATLGKTSTRDINAIANMAFVHWPANTSVGRKGPADFWPSVANRTPKERLTHQARHHALPIGWEQLDYPSFLQKRRKLIARVTREGFGLIGQNHEPISHSLQELLEAGESQTLEYKSTARFNLRAQMADKKMESVITKTVCGFINANGGTLLIGVDDTGQALGLDMDFSTFAKHKRNVDSYELWLRQRLDADLSISTAKVVDIGFEETSVGAVCVVTVNSSGKPVFARGEGSGSRHSDFWVRIGNATKQLYGYDQVEYIQDHWG